jgi:hypothetical protein
MISIAAFASACLVLLPLALYAKEITPPAVPPGIEVPAGHSPFLLGYATGTQNYICLSTDSAVAWSPLGPQATLFDEKESQMATHFLSPNAEEDGMARPTWQDSQDTSTVWASALQNSSDADFVEPEAIPWLLLQVVGTDFGPSGGDRLTKTTYMQRVHTSGGLAPATGCTDADDVHTRVFVPYTAEYLFYKATNAK